MGTTTMGMVMIEVALLALLLAAGWIWLRSWSPGEKSPTLDRHWQDFGFLARRRIEAAVSALPTGPLSRRMVALRDLQRSSRREPTAIVGIASSTSGARDRCRVTLGDGRVLRLTVFDAHNLRDFIASWRQDPTSGARLRWIEGLGWCCTLHTSTGSPAASQLWAYEADLTPAL